MSHKSKLGLLDRFATSINDGIVASLRNGIKGKLTTDNIDGRLITDQMRVNKKNKDYHYTASTYYPDRLATILSLLVLPMLTLDVLILNNSMYSLSPTMISHLFAVSLKSFCCFRIDARHLPSEGSIGDVRDYSIYFTSNAEDTLYLEACRVNNTIHSLCGRSISY